MSPRLCADCDSDITRRHFNAVRCEVCAEAVARERRNARRRARRNGNAEHLRKTREYRKAKRHDPEWRNRENARQRAYRAAHPERFAEYAAKKRTPEARAETNRRQRERYASDPEYRAKAKAVASARSMSRTQRNRLRRSLYFAQRGICALCRQRMPNEDMSQLHIDHVIPVARGGADDVSNLQLTHAACNMTKGATMPDRKAGEGR